jgi:hypothetical protein
MDKGSDARLGEILEDTGLAHGRRIAAMGWRLIWIGAVASALVACGNDAPAQSPSTSPQGSPGRTAAADTGSAQPVPDPCTLLTAAEIQQTLGLAVNDPDPSYPSPLDSDPDGLACAWSTADVGTPASATAEFVRVHVLSKQSWCDALADPHPGVRIDGLGDAATYHDESDQSICVKQGGRAIHVIADAEPNVDQSALTGLAEIAVSRV